jgi:hypothetical protein
MYERATKITAALTEAKLDPTMWDLACLSCVTLIAISEQSPELRKHIQFIVGTLIDGNITLKSTFDNNGILSIQSKQRSS